MSDRLLHMFRCTRNDPYAHECAGQHDLSARQGHYVMAVSEDAAIVEMRRSFPGDTTGFTVAMWEAEVGCFRCGRFNVYCDCKED